jgi:hypothetical protein
MPDFIAAKTGLFIPCWEAKLCFHGLEYVERERKGVLEDRDFWDPVRWEDTLGKLSNFLNSGVFWQKDGSRLQQIMENCELICPLF